jgi:hypothetical protein
MALPRIVIDGVTIQMPTEHGWIAPSSLGVGGAGNEVIPGIWAYPMTWNFMPPDSYKELYDIWLNNQGQNITVQIPEIGVDPYTLKSYTCRINPVTSRGFFEGHYRQVTTALVGIDITT